MKTVKAKNRLNNNNKKQADNYRILFFTSLLPALILMSFPSSFQFFIEWCTLCSAVCFCRLHPSFSHLACAVEFQEDFSVSNLPLRGLTIRRSCVCWSVCMRNAWDSAIVNIVLQTMKRQLFICTLVIDGNSKIAFSRMLPINKNAPWR